MQAESQSLSKQKITKHLTTIRREARHRIIQQKRNQMYFETQPLEVIVSAFGLPPGQYTITDLLANCYQELIDVGKQIGAMMEEMLEDRRKRSRGVLVHTWFWAFLVQELFTGKLTINQQLQTFFSDFLSRNLYQVLAEEPLLQLKVLNALQLSLVSASGSKSLRTQCLKWVRGSQGLTLIYNSLPNQFLCPQQFGTVYSILIQSLKLYSYNALQQVSEIIKSIMRTADYDDTYRIYSEKSQLMVAFLDCVSRFVEKFVVDAIVDAVVYLLDSYNSLIFDYARMGVGLLATQMIRSSLTPNISKGLQLIKYISEVEESDTIVYLVDDNELNEAGLWHSLLSTDMYTDNQNIDIRRQIFTILTNILSNGNYNTLCSVNLHSISYCNQPLLDKLVYSLQQEDDPTILTQIVTMLSFFLYYSQNYEPDSEDEEKVKSDYDKHKDQYFEELAERMAQMDVEKHVRRIAMHRNPELAQKAEKLCESLEFVAKERNREFGITTQ